MKKKLKPIVFRSAPGAFVDTLLQCETLTKKFRSTNLDFALHKAIEDGWLYVMPEGMKFAYCRGTGPVGLEKVRLGGHELKQKDSDMPDWNSPRLLVATYSIVLYNEEEDSDSRVSVDIRIPSKFTDLYVERADVEPHNPKFTRLEFKYDKDELRVWMREQQMHLYAEAERECHTEIRRLKARIEVIREQRQDGAKLPHQSAFG